METEHIKVQNFLQSGVMDRPLFESRRSIVVDLALVDLLTRDLNESRDSELLNEGLTKDIAGEVIQFLVAGAAEYGLGAVTIPAAGSGLAIGPMAETVVDSLFATKAVADAVAMVKDVSTSVGKFSDILSEAMGAVPKIKAGDFEGFYASVKKIVQEGLQLLGKKAKESADELAKKMREVIDKTIAKVVDAVTKGLKTLIPDATIGSAVSIAIKQVMEKLSSDCYSMLTAGIKKAGKLAKFITDPEVAPEFFKELLESIYKLMNEAKQKIEEMGWAKAILKFGPANAALMKKAGPTAIDKIIEAMKKFSPTLLDLIGNITKLVIPALFSMVAVVQILIKGEHKSDEEDSKKEESVYRRRAMTEERAIRSILRAEIRRTNKYANKRF